MLDGKFFVKDLTQKRVALASDPFQNNANGFIQLRNNVNRSNSWADRHRTDSIFHRYDQAEVRQRYV